MAQAFPSPMALPALSMESGSAVGKRKEYENRTPGSGSELRDRRKKKTKMKQTLGRNSLLSKPSDPLSSAVCGHPIHHAYRDRYTKFNCPVCLFEAAMKSPNCSQDTVFANTGPAYSERVT